MERFKPIMETCGITSQNKGDIDGHQNQAWQTASHQLLPAPAVRSGIDTRSGIPVESKFTHVYTQDGNFIPIGLIKRLLIGPNETGMACVFAEMDGPVPKPQSNPSTMVTWNCVETYRTKRQ